LWLFGRDDGQVNHVSWFSSHDYGLFGHGHDSAAVIMTRRFAARQALELIDRHPAVVSTVLAAELGVDRAVFKLESRKLKGSGLTDSTPGD
jgi:hypothetical protein